MNRRHTSIPQHRSRQAGDTIVEVVIAIAVIAAILTGAFLVSRSSTRAVRDSQEHAQALQLLQGQVEQLRTAAGGGTLGATPGTFCLVAGTTKTSGNPDSPPTNANCQVCMSNSQPVTDSNTCPGSPRFNLYITKVTDSGAYPKTSTFSLFTKWDALGGGIDSVGLTYKVTVQPEAP